jgi:hypothetical protein
LSGTTITFTTIVCKCSSSSLCTHLGAWYIMQFRCSYFNQNSNCKC